MKKDHLYLVLFAITFLPSCSSEQVYVAGQKMEQSRCVNEPAVNYQQCLEQSGMSYNEYVKLRAKSNQEQQ